MQDMSWLHNPALKNLHPAKMDIITQLIHEADGKPIAQSIPFLMRANQQLKEKGLSFTNEETTLIMEILSKDMTPKERQQMEAMKTFIQSKMK